MTQAVGYPTRINTNSSILIQGRILMSVTVNTKGSGGNTLTIYDGTDATGVIRGVVDTTAALGTFLYDVLMTTGIFLVLATGTPADLTIASY
jgi:hypothetical protein